LALLVLDQRSGIRGSGSGMEKIEEKNTIWDKQEPEVP
jgi:hypothetical protein